MYNTQITGIGIVFISTTTWHTRGLQYMQFIIIFHNANEPTERNPGMEPNVRYISLW